MSRDFMAEAVEVAKKGNYLIRADNNGESYGGFKWAGRGRWTKAPDWDNSQFCGGGLHGQCGGNGGFIRGSRLVFCKTKGPVIKLNNKVKVEEAMILLVNELPNGFTITGNLTLHGCTGLTSLPDGLSVGGSLDLLEGTGLTSLPGGLSVGGRIFGFQGADQ